MKVLLYGSEWMLRKLESSLNSGGNNTALVSTYAAVAEMGHADGFTLAVVDMMAPEATIVCGYLKKEWVVPVVVIMGFEHEQWRALDQIKVDGYISRTAGQAEILARLKAVQRRSPNSELNGISGR